MEIYFVETSKKLEYIVSDKHGDQIGWMTLVSPYNIGKRLYAPKRDETAPIVVKTTELFIFEKLEVSGIARTVYVGEKRIDVTEMQFNLLYFLMSHLGEAMTTDEICRHLELSTISNVLSAHIKNLRERIGAKYIETVIGYGFGIGLNKEND